MNIIPFPTPPETSMEALELQCMTYLGDAKTPIVPVAALLEFCRRSESLAHVSMDTLLGFLRGHADIEVLEGPTPEEQLSADLLGQAGVAMGPRAVLKRRIPTKRELHAHMAVQLQAMREALAKAQAAAGPGMELHAKRTEIAAAIEKVDELLARLASLMR